MRINKFLADCGVASRRASDKMIQDGEVKINGKVCKLGDDVDETRDSVTVDGKKIVMNTKLVYYIMYKPKGYICSVKDDKGRKTVMDLLPDISKRIYPVGRLDYDTEGLLILTNDGALTDRLTHPRNEIPKTYMAKIEGSISDADVTALRNGVDVDGKITNKCTVKVIEATKESTKLTLTITEGRNRQVRKMFEAVNKEVAFLKRIKIGDLSLRGLDRGDVRQLNAKEIDYLLNL